MRQNSDIQNSYYTDLIISGYQNDDNRVQSINNEFFFKYQHLKYQYYDNTDYIKYRIIILDWKKIARTIIDISNRYSNIIYRIFRAIFCINIINSYILSAKLKKIAQNRLDKPYQNNNQDNSINENINSLITSCESYHLYDKSFNEREFFNNFQNVFILMTRHDIIQWGDVAKHIIYAQNIKKNTIYKFFCSLLFINLIKRCIYKNRLRKMSKKIISSESSDIEDYQKEETFGILQMKRLYYNTFLINAGLNNFLIQIGINPYEQISHLYNKMITSFQSQDGFVECDSIENDLQQFYRDKGISPYEKISHVYNKMITSFQSQDGFVESDSIENDLQKFYGNNDSDHMHTI